MLRERAVECWHILLVRRQPRFGLILRDSVLGASLRDFSRSRQGFVRHFWLKRKLQRGDTRIDNAKVFRCSTSFFPLHILISGDNTEISLTDTGPTLNTAKTPLRRTDVPICPYYN